MMNRGDSPIMRRPSVPAVHDPILDEIIQGEDDDHDAVHNELRHRLPNPWPPDESDDWEELTEVDGRFLLRHDGKVYAAVEVPADSIIAQAFKVQDSEPRRVQR